MEITYEQALKDWKVLFEECDQAYDMTGGYVDQEDLDKLLKSPNKSTAKECLRSQIVYWFDSGTEDFRVICDPDKVIERYPAAKEIAERHGII